MIMKCTVTFRMYVNKIRLRRLAASASFSDKTFDSVTVGIISVPSKFKCQSYISSFDVNLDSFTCMTSCGS